MTIKTITKAGSLVAGTLLASQAAHAQFTANDVYLGFQNSSASDDYIVNLGSLSSIIGQTSVVNLSGDFLQSDFDAVYGTGSGTTLAAAVGASSTTADAFGTEVRTSNIGDSAVAGSTGPTSLLNYTQDGTVYTSLSSMKVTSGGTLDATKSWSSAVSPTEASGNYFSATGFNPNGAITTSSVLYEDLYVSTDTSGGGRGDSGHAFTYEGYFTLDFDGSTPDVTFTGADVTAVPEPATYGILAGVGMLLLALRRQFTGLVA